MLDFANSYPSASSAYQECMKVPVEKDVKHLAICQYHRWEIYVSIIQFAFLQWEDGPYFHFGRRNGSKLNDFCVTLQLSQFIREIHLFPTDGGATVDHTTFLCDLIFFHWLVFYLCTCTNLLIIGYLFIAAQQNQLHFTVLWQFLWLFPLVWCCR